MRELFWFTDGNSSVEIADVVGYMFTKLCFVGH